MPGLTLPRGPWNTPRPQASALAEESARLPERADVWWRPLIDEAALERYARQWHVSTLLHVAAFLTPGLVLLALEPLTFPVLLACLGWSFTVPGLYAGRGAKVIRPKPTRAGEAAEARSVGMLGDLLGHEARELHRETGLVLERGRFGVWLLGDAGAFLLRGRTVHCWCVRVPDAALPRGDRTAHLLLALRADEAAFATVANRAFAGARWRVRAWVPDRMRPAFDRAVAEAKAVRQGGGSTG